MGVFSPAQGLLPGRTAQWNERTETLLRGRLRAFLLLISFAAAAFALRRLFVDTYVPLWFPALSLVTAISLTLLLYSSARLTLWPLRALEVFTFWGLTIYMTWADAHLVRHAIFVGNPDVAVGQTHLAAVHAVLLIVAYGLFIPNNWQRAALIVIPIAAAPVMLAVGLLLQYPDTFSAVALDPEVGLLQIGDVWLMLALAVAASIYGTHVINRFRSAAATAEEMGQYQLDRKLGEGGMGEVWLAQHSMLARPAAIKLIRPEMLEGAGSESPGQTMRRFEREAQATATLRSLHTVELYDFGTTEEGVFYYVMEYLDGYDLETLVRKHGPIQPERAVHLLRQACDSLADAHACGMIHRDIKPANMFTCRMGEAYDVLKVLDFGLVKPMPGGEEMTKLTQRGIAGGTPAYMPPEIATGDSEPDARADLYCLGCVAYWLVTGHLVFESDSPMAMVIDHAKADPVRPSARTEIDLPAELDRLILTCLEKDPAKRFQSAEELSDALAAVPLERGWDKRNAASWWQLHAPQKPGDQALAASPSTPTAGLDSEPA